MDSVMEFGLSESADDDVRGGWSCVSIELRAGLQRRGRVHSAVLGHRPQVVQLRRQHADEPSAQRQILVDRRHSGRQQDGPRAQATGRRPRSVIVFQLAPQTTCQPVSGVDDVGLA